MKISHYNINPMLMKYFTKKICYMNLDVMFRDVYGKIQQMEKCNKKCPHYIFK